MGGTGEKRKPPDPKLAKSHTFTSHRRSSSPEVVPAINRNSLTQHSASEPTLAPHQPQAHRGEGQHSSVLDEQPFGERYAYGLAEGAALNPLEPWKVAAAVGRDVGQFLLGSVGWKPSQAAVGQDQASCQQSACKIMNGKLKAQAEACAQKAKLPNKGLSHTELHPSSKDLDASGSGSEAVEGKVKDVEYEESKTSTSYSDEDEDEQDTPKGEGSGKQRTPSGRLGRVSADSSQATGDITVSGTGHYQMNNDAILRLECMGANEVRFLNFMLWTCLTIATAFLIYLFVRKLVQPNWLQLTYKRVIINTVIAGTCLLVLSLVALSHTTRIVLTLINKKVWKPRRTQVTILVSIELFAQWANALFFLLPNTESFGPDCFQIIDPKKISYYALARWTCWNTIFLISLINAHNANLSQEKSITSSSARKSVLRSSMGSMPGRRSLKTEQALRNDLAVMDLPFLQAHWWKLIIWLLMEIVTIADCIYYAKSTGPVIGSGSEYFVPCVIRQEYCGLTRKQLGLTSIMVFFAVLYFCLYCYFIHRALKQLGTRSASEFRIANIVVRMQMRLRLPAFSFFTLSILLLWYVKPFSCNSLIDTWYGMLPTQIVATAAVCLQIFVATPKLCGGLANQTVLQVWLQEFAWTEEEKPRKLARRNTAGPPGVVESELSKQPMFCVETMMKSLYWSLLIYDFQEVDDSKLTLEEACALFSPPLEHYELFWEKSLDTKMILAWSRQRIVMSFRGTASLANVVADLQAWRMMHVPKRGNWFRRPKVHSGFDKAWRNNGLNCRVLERVEKLFHEKEVDASCRILITGHSLGGALATLSAYDIRALGKKYGCKDNVTCITFGSPRAGNHAFARDLEEMVPDCWHIINDQDVVAKGAKFVAMYKRGGHRVLINKLGDLIVRPSPMETSIRLVPCSGSVQQHLLTSYLQSLLAVLTAQFTNKKMKGGMSGVVQLAKESVPIKRLLLEEAGLKMDDLVYMMRWGAYAPKVAGIASLNMTARKKGSLTRDVNDRTVGDAQPTTRGGFMCGCCRPIAVKIKEARGQQEDEEPAEDANIRDGGDVSSEGDEPMEATQSTGPEKV